MHEGHNSDHAKNIKTQKRNLECTFQYDMFFGMSKKEDILNTTLKIVIEKGIHNTPMSLIAQEAGVGMGTIYNYFDSKAELINALFLKLKEDEAAYMLKNFKSGIPVRHSFSFFWKNILQYFIHHPKEFQFLEQFYFSPLIDLEARRQGAVYFSELTKVYEEGQNQEVLKKGDITQQIYFTHGSLASLAKFHILGDIRLDKKAIEDAVTAAWDALKR
jgi:AcrR family transcriptional regulator